MHKSYNYEVAVKFLISPSLVSGRAYERIKTFMNSELISQLSEGNLPKQRRLIIILFTSKIFKVCVIL